MAPLRSRPEPFETERSFKERGSRQGLQFKRLPGLERNRRPSRRGPGGWVAGSSPAMTAVGGGVAMARPAAAAAENGTVPLRANVSPTYPRPSVLVSFSCLCYP